MSSIYDYIIVGGGTTGVTIAARLKQYLPDSRIALLEAGPNAVDHPKVNAVSDGSEWLQLMGEGLVVDYSTAPQPHLDHRKLMNPAGRLLSGSSGVNVGNWMRPSVADCDLIAERAGSDKFKFKNLVKYFKRLEKHFDPTADPEQYGFEGGIHTIGGRKYPLRDILQETAEKLGHRYNPNATKGDPIGLVDFVQNFKATSDSTAVRQHSARVYDLTGVDVVCDSPVSRILFDSNNRATGVELISGEALHANKEIIVSCGTQRTPQLLMLSGIGPAPELSKHKISLILDAPAVGQNLFDHSAMFQFYRLKDATKGYARPFTGTLRPEYNQGLPVDFTLFGNIPSPKLLPHLLADSEASSSVLLDDKRAHFMNLTFYDARFAPPALYPSITEDEDNTHIGLAAIHLLPLSRGSVSLASADPKDGPVCDPKYMSTATDRFIMRHAIRQNISLASTSPFANVIDTEIPPEGHSILSTESSDEEIDARVRAMCMTVSHPMGTCALGSVLDGEFRVKGIKGLRVCDASVFPEPVGAMPSCLVYALGEMGAEMVAGRS
jgi:choline dehydrogenase-like flavoprotein